MGITEYLDSLSATHKSRVQTDLKRSGSGSRRIGTTWGYFPFSGRGADGWAQETSSLNHPHFKHRGSGTRDIGGPFYTRKVSVVASDNQYPCLTIPGNVSGTYNYSGPLYPSMDSLKYSRLAADIFDDNLRLNSTWTTDNALSRANLRAEGLSLMVNSMPSTPAFSAANSIGELISENGRLPSLPGLNPLERGELPSEWLNYQFGILPVISDVKGAREAARKSAQIMEQYLRDAGKHVRRRREIPTSITNTNEEYPSTHANGKLIAPPSYVLNSGFYRNGKLQVHTHTERDVWFSGAFEYYVPPEADAWARTLFKYNAVYGFVPSPVTLWELTPFSWLADWFVNTDDLVSSLFAAGPDGSVLVRGYVMCKTVTETTLTWTGDLAVNGSWKPVSMKFIVKETVKQRERTRPYGLDWNMTSLTARQASILTALGLSRR